MAGEKDTASFFCALSKTLGGAVLQQSCEAGISICAHWLFMMRQQARSRTIIGPSEAIHATAGATQDTSNSKITPNWRKHFT